MNWLGVGLGALVAASGWMFAAIQGWRSGRELVDATRHNVDLRIQLGDRESDVAELQNIRGMREGTEKRLRKVLKLAEGERDDAYRLLKELRPAGAAGAVFDSLLRRSKERSEAQ